VRILWGNDPEEDAIIDRALTEVYAAKDITPQTDPKLWAGRTPLMQDLESVLEGMEGADSLVRRIPMALGPLVGGVLIASQGRVTGVRLAFIIALVLALVALFMQQRFIENVQTPKKAEKNPFRITGQMSPALIKLLIADILVRFCEQIPYAFMAIWVMENNNLSSVYLWTAFDCRDGHSHAGIHPGRVSGRPRVEKTFRGSHFCLLYPLSVGAHGFAQCLDVHPCLHHPWLEGIWRTHPQSHDHGPRTGRAKSGHVRVVLPAQGCDRFGGCLFRRVVVEPFLHR